MAGALTLLALAGGTPASGAQGKGRVGSLIGNRVHTPTVSSNPLVLRLAVVLRRGVNARHVTAELLDVGAPGGRQPVYFDKFGVAFQKPRPSRGPALLVTVATSPALAAGSYKLRIGLREARHVQRLAFQIRIAPAVLRQPGTIRIRRTERWPFHDGVERHLLPLRETGRRSQITNVSVKQVDPLRMGTDQAPGSIGVRAGTPVAVVPGGFAEATIEPRGSFPIGTSTGKAEIDAGELAAATQVDVEVTQVLSRGYLIFILLGGVVLGYLTRTELTKRIQRAEALAQIAQMLRRIQRDRIRHPDRTFLERMVDIEDDLRAARETEDGDKIEAAVTKAVADRDAALKALQERADAVNKEHAELADTLATRRDTLPADLSTALEGAQRGLELARARLDAGDVSGAADLVASIRHDVTRAAADSGRAWKRGAQPFVAAYDAPSRESIASADPAVREKADAATSALAVPALANPDASAADQLAGLAAAIDAVDALVRALATSAGLVVAQAREILPAEATTHLVLIAQALEELVTALRQTASHSPDAYAAARSRDRDLAQLLADAVEQVAEVTEAGEPVRLALAGGDFIGAARLAVAAHPENPQHRAFMPAAPALTSPVRTVLLDAPAAPASQAEPTPAGTAAPQGSPVVIDQGGGLDVVHQDDRKALYWATFAQTALLALVVVIVGYLTFADQWTGTTANIVTAFTAGYLADLGVDAVRRRVEGLKPGAAGGNQAPAPPQPAGPPAAS
jgi:hypothetical protein